MTAAGRASGRGGHGLLEQLMAVVRPEFRTEIYIPAPDDPVFAAGKCAVAGCDRTAVQRGLCNGHVIRWRQRGRPALEDFLADSGPPVRGRIPLAPCKVDGCRYGRGGGGLCSRHRDRWDRAGTPDLATWDAPELVTPGARPAECRLPFCTLWVENPAKIFCRSHDDRWQRHGRPDPGRFIADCELTGTAHIDLRGLAPQLRMEFQYALQCRHDARSRTAAAAPGDASGPAGQDGGRDLAAGSLGAAMAAGRRFPGPRAGAVPARRPRRRGIPAGRDRLGGRVRQGRLAAAQAARHRRPGRALPARPAAVRPHHPALAAGARQAVDAAAADLRPEHRRGKGGAGRADLLQPVPHPGRRRRGSPTSTARCWNVIWPG